ncbi:transposase [Gluconacetobacter sp. SXCC-1]|nr:transposase [Gluconacetobacter sp. SXCC-1]
MIQDFMNGGASVEETLELSTSGLRAAKERIEPLFTHKRVAASAYAFLDVARGRETAAP